METLSLSCLAEETSHVNSDFLTSQQFLQSALLHLVDFCSTLFFAVTKWEKKQHSAYFLCTICLLLNAANCTLPVFHSVKVEMVRAFNYAFFFLYYCEGKIRVAVVESCSTAVKSQASS